MSPSGGLANPDNPRGMSSARRPPPVPASRKRGIARRGKEPSGRLSRHRWVIERTLSSLGGRVRCAPRPQARCRDCLPDVAMLRAEPTVFGPGRIRPCRLPARRRPGRGGLPGTAGHVTVRNEVRERAWKLAGDAAPDAGGELVVDMDVVRVLAHPIRCRSRPVRAERRAE
ncbi:hypothetical protein GCM10009802_05430 [Streptomyces synnematoformans]|uniref:Transposase n=1 Tax=Streptomyces synnematoformans TaxID=415721 RepID=A0ABN2XBV4_9ACTN